MLTVITQVTTSAIAACLREHNVGNNLAQRMMGLYLYASGVQRQNFTVLSKLGICTSYTDLMRNEEVKVRSSASAATSENNPNKALRTVTPATRNSNDTTPHTSAASAPFHTSSTTTSDHSPSTPLHTSSTSPSDPKPKKRRLGLLRLLSNGLRVQTRTVASVGLFGEVYDNINFMSRTAEQVIGRHGQYS